MRGQIFYTCTTYFLNEVAIYPSNFVPPDEVDQIDPATIPDRIYGSKMVIGQTGSSMQIWH